MEASAERYARWKAPTQDGELLIWPQPGELLADTRTNHARLSGADDISIQNLLLSELRPRMRQWLGHSDDSVPLIVTGHQTELHHPGVWVKNALIDAIAATTGGNALHFAVDTDEPKHLSMRWPGGSVPLTDDPKATSAQWTGLMNPPTPAHLAEVERQFAEAATKWNFTPLVSEFIYAMRRQVLATDDLSSALMNALHSFDADLGLRYQSMLVSKICQSEPYLAFVHHVLARADEFGSAYNGALEEFRRQNKIRTPGRPMPNLNLADDECEVPFWLDSLASGSRTRASVIRVNGLWTLRTADAEFSFDAEADGWEASDRLLKWLRQHGLRISPRALTLTAVLRLLVADLFVHGIGGGQYDQVLDALIASHFGLEPPRFAVATATLFFPEAVGQPRVCLPCLLQEGHRQKHRALGPRKMEWVREIESLPRRSMERSTAFHQMHNQLTAAWQAPTVKSWESTIREAEARAIEERVLFDRELFYAIQPRERLADLIDRCRAQFA